MIARPPGSGWSVVKAGDAAAAHTGMSRNVRAERGEGRAWRHEPNMTPVLKARMVKRSNRTWGQSGAVEVKKDLTGRPGALTVAVRSANNANAGAIGLRGSSWGIAGFGDDAPAAPAQRNFYLIGGLAALAAAFLLLSGNKS